MTLLHKTLHLGQWCSWPTLLLISHIWIITAAAFDAKDLTPLWKLRYRLFKENVCKTLGTKKKRNRIQTCIRRNRARSWSPASVACIAPSSTVPIRLIGSLRYALSPSSYLDAAMRMGTLALQIWLAGFYCRIGACCRQWMTLGGGQLEIHKITRRRAAISTTQHQSELDELKIHVHGCARLVLHVEALPGCSRLVQRTDGRWKNILGK